MNLRIYSKNGMFKTVITIFAVLFLIFVFIVFAFLFGASAKNAEGNIGASFTYLNSQFLLQTFLKSPVSDVGSRPPPELNRVAGEMLNYADLVSLTCNNNKDRIYTLLKTSVNTYFKAVYGEEWEFLILYSNPALKKKDFGYQRYVEDDITRNKGNKIASQTIPCQDGTMAVAMFYTEGTLPTQLYGKTNLYGTTTRMP